jgi:hypothetical protein
MSDNLNYAMPRATMHNTTIMFQERQCMPLTMGENDRLELDLRFSDIAVFARQHVHLSLVHAELTNIRLHMGSQRQDKQQQE